MAIIFQVVKVAESVYNNRLTQKYRAYGLTWQVSSDRIAITNLFYRSLMYRLEPGKK